MSQGQDSLRLLLQALKPTTWYSFQLVYSHIEKDFRGVCVCVYRYIHVNCTVTQKVGYLPDCLPESLTCARGRHMSELGY